MSCNTEIQPSTVSKPDCKTSITVQDLQFETQPDGEQHACIALSVVAESGPVRFDVTVPLHDQCGTVEASLHEAQVRLVQVFDDLVDELTTAPLTRG